MGARALLNISSSSRSGRTQKSKIKQMLEMKVAEPAEKEWAVPIDWAPKRDRSEGFYLDYRNLSAETEHDSYPISRMDWCISLLVDAFI